MGNLVWMKGEMRGDWIEGTVWEVRKGRGERLREFGEWYWRRRARFIAIYCGDKRRGARFLAN